MLSNIISQFAYFEANKSSLISELYQGRKEDLQQEFQKTETYLRDFNDDFRPKFYQLLQSLPSDLTLIRTISHLSKEGILSFSELNKLCLLIESAELIKKDFPHDKISEFKNIKGTDFNPLHRNFVREFRHLVDSHGEVHFDRHPVLSDLNKRLRELEERIRRTVQDWLTQPAHAKVLQYNSYDVHYDRFVVPVRSDSYRSELGLIVSRSDSGNTLFVEPFEVREACNRRMELIAKIDELINQLAIKFSRSLGESTSTLEFLYYQLLKIDHYIAKVNFSNKFMLERPRIKATPGFKFSQLFHPLLKNPVKNSADCEKSHHGIVISGPNTGGKTVFLKSITLAYLLFYHGFFVPAQEAEMYPYEGLFYFGNDLQDLQGGLSSFSGEVRNYIELLEHILPTNLILIDEIFNSTSSDEASALSLAYFDELHSRSTCHIVVSTHHQMFKTLIHQDRNYISCHVGFDVETMKPTYKIIWGTPGASMAVDIFQLLAQSHERLKDVPQKARSLLSKKNVSYETLLQKVSQKQIELDQLLQANRQHEVELRNQKGALEGIARLKVNEELARAKNEIDKIISEARSFVIEAKRSEVQKVRRVDEKALQLKTKIGKIQSEDENPEEIPSGDLDINAIRVGDTVFSLALKKEFVVQAIDLRKKEVLVAKGPIKINLPVQTLSKSIHQMKEPRVSVSFQKSSQSKVEYDTRGMRLSEFQSTVEKALGDLLVGDIPYLAVIHGHGDGVLKKWLRSHVEKSDEFSIQNNHSDDGKTYIILK